MAFKKFRELKVYEICDYKYESIPTIRLTGKWLKELGFDIGMSVVVKCQDGKLEIVKVE